MPLRPAAVGGKLLVSSKLRRRRACCVFRLRFVRSNESAAERPSPKYLGFGTPFVLDIEQIAQMNGNFPLARRLQPRWLWCCCVKKARTKIASANKKKGDPLDLEEI